MNELFEKAVSKNDLNPLEPRVRPFIADPDLLPLASREELIYKYKYLEDSITSLASQYRVRPDMLEDFIEEHQIKRTPLNSAEDFDNLNKYVQEMYVNIRIRLSGLVALQTAKIWEGLAETEDLLLDSLKEAATDLNKASFIDPKTINTLVSAHAKIVDRQELIRRAIEVPAENDIKKIASMLSEDIKDLMESIDGDHGLPK